MIAWTDAAFALTVLAIVECLALVVIAVRRARFRERRHAPRVQPGQAELISLHARWFEGPASTALLVVAILTGASPLFANDGQRVLILGLVVAMVRASVITIATFSLAGYWKVRGTWLPR